MKERPILFNGEMVKAVLDGRKTMTRRVVKARWYDHAPTNVSCDTVKLDYYEADKAWREMFVADNRGSLAPKCWRRFCPYGEPGNRLWVRETWKPDRRLVPLASGYASDLCGAAFKADNGFRHVFDIAHHFGADWGNETCWRPSIHMPRWASRITLEITDVRVERVQEISEADAMAEGVRPTAFQQQLGHRPASRVFWSLWDSINAASGYGWDANPWVWVITFRRVQ